MSSDSLSSDEDNLEVAPSTEEEETLEQFMNDDSKVSPADRIQTMISLCFAYVKDFSTDVAPFNHSKFNKMKRKHKPTAPILKKEIKRRKPDMKGYAHKKIADLLVILQGDDFKLPDKLKLVSQF